MAGMINKPYGAPAGFDRVTRLTRWREVGGVLCLDLETAKARAAALRVMALSHDIWRWTFLPPGSKDKTPTPSVVWPAGRRLPLAVEKTDSGLTIRGRRSAWRLVIEADPWSMRFVDRRGRTVFSENPADVDGLGRPFVSPLGFFRRGRPSARTTTMQSFHLRPEDRLYGLGEKFTRLDKTHQTIVSWTEDALGSTSERSHKNVPFVW